MAQPTGVLGSKLYVSATAIADTIDSEAEFTAVSDWTEISLIESFGEFGRVFDPVNFQAVADGRMYKFKGGYNDGNMQVVMGQDLSDTGQAVVKTASEASTQDNYGFRIELNNADTSVGGPTTYFFRGLMMSFATAIGSVNNVAKSTANVEINSSIIRMPRSELYDRFITGSSLTHYELFAGSDPQAVAPLITSNAIRLLTGDANGGHTVDGSQLIGDNGYVPSAGPIVVEARLQVDAITTVAIFFGLTDQKVALEAPITGAGVNDDITTNATDAVGFLFDTAMTNDTIWLVGVNNNVDETAQNSTLAYMAGTYKTLRIELSAAGTAVFYIDGVAIGTPMTTAVATGVTLYPTIIAFPRATVQRLVSGDYLYLRQDQT